MHGRGGRWMKCKIKVERRKEKMKAILTLTCTRVNTLHLEPQSTAQYEARGQRERDTYPVPFGGPALARSKPET